MKKSIILAVTAFILLNGLTWAKNPVYTDGFFFGKNKLGKEIRYSGKILPQNWTVSQYGFLVFPVAADLEEFLTFIKSKTHAEAQEYLSSISFTSLGAGLYGQEYADQAITDDQAINYVLNPSRVFQIHGIVIKPVSQATNCEDVKWQYVLAMSSSNLSSESYYSFSRGIYDGSVMNKYATNPPASDTLSLVQKMSQSDAGYQATDPNPCPTTQAEKRPFWGWSQATCTSYTGNECYQPNNPNAVCYYYCPPMYYIFWIQVNNNGGCYGLLPGASCPPPAQ